MTEQPNSPMKEWIEDALHSVTKQADVNTVIGDPVTLPNGTTIVPFSKVSVGLATGGSDRAPKTTDKQLFAGGGGAGVSVTPLGFLVVSADGDVKLLDLKNPDSYAPKPNPIDTLLNGTESIMDRAPDLIARCKQALDKRKQETDEPSEAPSETGKE